MIQEVSDDEEQSNNSDNYESDQIEIDLLR